MARYNVVVIGGGPGGYVAAIRAAQLGLKVALIERERVGGVCLNWGCIPSKALLHSAELIDTFSRASDFGVYASNLRADLGQAVEHSRTIVDQVVKGVEFLLRRNGVETINGEARLIDPRRILVSTAGQTIETDATVIATGAGPKTLPGIAVDGDRVMTSREALALQEPPASIAIIGGGAVGVEFAYLYRAFGSRVTLIEMTPHLLPAEDEDVSALLERALSKQGIEVLTGTRVEELELTDRTCRVRLSGREGEKAASYDKILLGVGIRANIENTGLLELNATITDGGFIDINDRMQTSIEGVYAVGDVTGVMPLAHVASAQGAAAAEAIAGRVHLPLVYSDMPRAVYSRPQVASVGLTQAAAEARGYSVRAARFPVRANSKALAVGESEGFAKLVIDSDSDEVIGCHMIGPDVTELIGGLSLARVLGARATDVASAVYPHPTLSEMVKEAALATKGEAVHFWFEKAAASYGSG